MYYVSNTIEGAFRGPFDHSEALKFACSEFGEGASFFVGTLDPVTPEWVAMAFFDEDYIDYFCNDLHESVIDKINVTDDASIELRELVVNWVKKHNMLGLKGCGEIVNIKLHVVTNGVAVKLEA